MGNGRESARGSLGTAVVASWAFPGSAGEGDVWKKKRAARPRPPIRDAIQNVRRMTKILPKERDKRGRTNSGMARIRARPSVGPARLAGPTDMAREWSTRDTAALG